MRKALTFASLLTMAALVACGGGGGGSTTPMPISPPANNSVTPTSTVSVLVVVPSGSQTTSTKRRPAFTAPNGTQSLSIALTSVNGAASGGSPTVFPLTGTNCEAGNNDELCTVSLTAPVGVLLYTVNTFTSANGSGTPNGAGVFQVQTVAGKTITVSTALSGAVAKLAVLLNGTAELGATASIQVFVNGLDASGNTILGSYSSPVNVTLNDTDASGQTNLSGTSLTLYGSSATSSISLNYLGGAMTTAAIIGASANGISGANITPASFLPDATAPTVNGASTSFAYVSEEAEGGASAVPSPWPTYTGSYTVGVQTGQSFNGVNNLVALTGLQEPTTGSPSAFSFNDYCCPPLFDSNSVVYFAWAPSGNTTSLGYVGVSDPSNDSGYDPTQLTCASPYSNQLVLPFPSSWNVLNGAGSCAYSQTFDYGEFGGETGVFQSDGSYSLSYNFTPPGDCSGGPCEYYNTTSLSNGGASLSEFCFGDGGELITIPAPSPGAALVSATISSFAEPNATPPATPTPAPITTTAPNPWLAFSAAGAPGLAGGTPPNPLESDTFATVGSIAALPAGCAVGAGIVPASNPSLNEADESIVYADPTDDLNANYATNTIKHYYLDGVGEICNEQIYNSWYMDDGPYGWFTYVPEDNTVDAYSSITWTYVSTTSLTATYAHVRNFAQALPATTQAFTAATYALIHSHVGNANRATLPRALAAKVRSNFSSFQHRTTSKVTR